MEPNIYDWNIHIRGLLSSIVGIISPNFRMITLSYGCRAWLVEFFLEQEKADDLDEINESFFEYSNGIEDSLTLWPPEWDYNFSDNVNSPINIKIYITSELISVEEKDRYLVIFKRKEF